VKRVLPVALTLLLIPAGTFRCLAADLKELLKPVPGAQSERDPVRARQNNAGKDAQASPTVKKDPVSADKAGSGAGEAGLLRDLTEVDLVDAVQKDLLRRFPSLGELKVFLTRPWKPVPLPAGDFFAECLQLPGNGLQSNMNFTVRVVSAGKIVGEFPIQSRVELWQDVWVSSQRLDKGTVLDRGMLNSVRVDALREYVSPLTVDQDYLGFEVSQPLQAGRPLTRRDIVEKTVVKRGQLVEAVAAEGGIKIRMRAMAMEAGPAGAVIRVKNVDSQKEFVAQVLNENQVQVRF
jgi:flagella basal body P-ring formation protein FlgA